MLRFLTAGESHGPGLAAIIEGVPAGLELSEDDIARDLRRRQMGYGRGARMNIERDRAQILSGVHKGKTTGSPIALLIENKDWANWKEREVAPIRVPRPGHAELAGSVKYGHEDMRIIAERASARNTATIVAVGAVARKFLASFDVTIFSQVIEIGGIKANPVELPLAELIERLEASSLRCTDAAAEEAMRQAIDGAKGNGDSLGGVFEVRCIGVPAGLGSYVQWERHLDGRLAQAIMSIQAIKGVEIGDGFSLASKRGTEANDELFVENGRLVRKTNHAGGAEGGVSNGEPIVIRAAMKPIPTTATPQRSVDVTTLQPARSQYQRSDVCAVPAAGVVAEAMAAWTIADAFLEKLGGDSLSEIKSRFTVEMR